jgi:glycosyltransferase involved in cell wall biosynthesis
MSEPLITVGLPVYNAGATLAAAVTSIRAQTYSKWELLIIDDGSTDGSHQIGMEAQRRDDRIRFVYDGRHLGLPARLNELIASANGELFARMDADDVAYPRRLECQAAFLIANPTVDVVGSAMVVFGGEGALKGVRRGRLSHAEICAHPEWGFRMFHPTWTGRTAWFARYGYRPGDSEDQDLLLRAYLESQYANLPEVLLGYRQHRHRSRYTIGRRRFFTGRAVRRMLRDGRAHLALSAVLKMLVLGLADMTAFSLRLEDRVLRQRAAPASPAEIREWRSLWLQIAARAAPERQNLKR